MKKYAVYIAFALGLVLFSLSACQRSQSTPAADDILPSTIDDAPSPTAGVLTQLPDALASQTAAPTIPPIVYTPTSTALPVQPTAEPPTPTEAPPQPTTTPAPSLEPLTKTSKPATATPSGPVSDPYEL